MRGSVYYQTAQLTKLVFKENAKKEQKTNSKHKYFNCVSSYKTMETYRSVWNNLFNYLREQFGIKNCELITEEHIKSYFEYKIEYYCSKQYAEKLSSALAKLEFALNKYSKNKYKDTNKTALTYDFQVRQSILNNARDYNKVAKNYKNRTYQNPYDIINNLTHFKHKIAATVQLTGGARAEGVMLIKENQLKGTKTDFISNKRVGVLETREKGGKTGDVFISISAYESLKIIIEKEKQFRISYNDYIKDIKCACKQTNNIYQSTHGFRWTFAQNRVREYQQLAHYSYYEAIQIVSWEMKHYRASITEHYLS